MANACNAPVPGNAGGDTHPTGDSIQWGKSMSYNYRRKYQVQIQTIPGIWKAEAVWAVYPSDFRGFIAFLHGECPGTLPEGQEVPLLKGPPIRVKRVSDDAAPQFVWPDRGPATESP